MTENFQLMPLKLIHMIKASRDERGATAVEYGLMVALIALVIIAAVTTLGTNLNTQFTSASTLN
ncbi:Flp family type IVb pilin [Nocardioides baculatus]|uniref:Flp family type IVb pilin n=1 Tax=Nocardioides baculatus TaxID=2801337 RepID=A0ABS1L6Z0_9ACTN|nr:Flp family type IVb pilin [Nocardioides baculatus]MBL0747464.1 Flp family type IVb pilin [Nocardioides baculatus]